MMRLWPFRHFGLKVWSVLLAVMLWMAIAGEETVERGVRAPLELQQFPPGLELRTEPPSVVDLRVRGASSALSRVGTGDLVAVLDLRSARAGRRLYQLTPEQVRAPFGIEVVQVTPSSLVFAFEQTATRRVPVVPSLDGEPAPGFVVGKLLANPAQVDVMGPESAVAAVAEALTEPVSIGGASKDVTQTVMVGLQDPVLRLKAPRPATVTAQIIPGPAERTLHARPVHLRNLGSKLTAQALPPTADVVLRGARVGLDRLDTDKVEAFVDLSGLGAGEYALGVRVDVAPSAGVARITPSSVQVRISSVSP
jgi:YbbR domain-containing protein